MKNEWVDGNPIDRSGTVETQDSFKSSIIVKKDVLEKTKGQFNCP